MGSTQWRDLYGEAKSGQVAGVPASNYLVRVDAVRTLPASRLLFMDLEISAGPLTGKIVQVSLWLPEAGNRNAGFHFRNKILGFGDLTEAFTKMDDAADIEAALDTLADALVGRTVSAEIGLVGEGTYAGSNELQKTSPSDSSGPAPLTATELETASQLSGPDPTPIEEPVQVAVASVEPEQGVAVVNPF